MKSINFNNIEYYTVKEIYTNLCLTRNSVIKKIKKLESLGYVLRVKNKRPEIYISKKGYDLLKKERINYLNNEIAKAENEKLKNYYKELKEAIGKPELWNKYHQYESWDKFYRINNEMILIESRKNGKTEKYI